MRDERPLLAPRAVFLVALGAFFVLLLVASLHLGRLAYTTVRIRRIESPPTSTRALIALRRVVKPVWWLLLPTYGAVAVLTWRGHLDRALVALTMVGILALLVLGIISVWGAFLPPPAALRSHRTSEWTASVPPLMDQPSVEDDNDPAER